MNEHSHPTPRLLMRGVERSFGATRALDGVDLAVPAGEVHALIGVNGAGKSTLMKILSGALRPDAGEMALDGKPYAPAGPLDARTAGVAMIYQELSLAPDLTVAALGRLGHSEVDPDAPVRGLPVAARQIVEIARGLAVGSRVLVLDEPTSALAREDVVRLFAVLARLKADGYSIVYISHFLEEVREVADRFTVLRDGRVAGSGDTDAVTIGELAALMVGRDLGGVYPERSRTPGETVLELTELAGAVKPVSASLALRRGEVLGIAGLVGAGRTELLRAIFGLDPVRSGRVRVDAHIGPASPARRWAQGVGYLSEDRKEEGLALSMSVADNLTLSKSQGLGPAGLILPGRLRRAAQRWILELDLRCQGPDQPVADLSGGNQQKVALARLLHHDADVLLLDEPTKGIDVASKAQLYRLIGRLAAGDKDRRPRAVLIVSSYMPELIGLCDRIAVMSRGRLLPARPAADYDERRLMLEAAGAGTGTGAGA